VLLTVTTTREPATDLGYLLVKHPDRVHSFDVSTGTAHLFFPEAEPHRCTAALLLEVDPRRLAAGSREGFTLGQFVNDRPYAASSLLAAALNRVLRTAMRGESDERPEMAATALPLRMRIPVLRCRGGADLAERLFAPLGWTVRADAVPLDETFPAWGPSRYLDLTLTGEVRLADALNQLYVLLPVLDDAKHYWVSPDEVDKLLRAGTGWLAAHPAKDLITRRYLAHNRGLAAHALGELAAAELAAAERLAEVDDAPAPDSVDAEPPTAADEEAQLPEPAKRIPLAEQRRRAVLAALAETAPARVLDLGCGSGALLADLVRERRHTEIVGVDVSPSVLRMAERRLRLDRLPERQRDRVRLWQSALTYTDDRLVGYDAAVLMEVIEHVDLPRLPAVAASVFGHARPARVIVTTPNVEYNVRFPDMTSPLRHGDHRFEWTRAEFAAWCTGTAARYGYRVEARGVGEDDPEVGPPTQMAVFDLGEPTTERAPASEAEATSTTTPQGAS
jgi:3' terminal RNA ribose 2'-O-methyltransferase Hen1